MLYNVIEEGIEPEILGIRGEHLKQLSHATDLKRSYKYTFNCRPVTQLIVIN